MYPIVSLPRGGFIHRRFKIETLQIGIENLLQRMFGRSGTVSGGFPDRRGGDKNAGGLVDTPMEHLQIAFPTTIGRISRIGQSFSIFDIFSRTFTRYLRCLFDVSSLRIKPCGLVSLILVMSRLISWSISSISSSMSRYPSVMAPATIGFFNFKLNTIVLSSFSGVFWCETCAKILQYHFV